MLPSQAPSILGDDSNDESEVVVDDNDDDDDDDDDDDVVAILAPWQPPLLGVSRSVTLLLCHRHQT